MSSGLRNLRIVVLAGTVLLPLLVAAGLTWNRIHRHEQAIKTINERYGRVGMHDETARNEFNVGYDQIASITISDPEFDLDLLTDLQHVERLETLKLDQTAASDGLIPFLTQVENLRALSLNRTTVGDGLPAAISHFRFLRTLRLNGTEVTNKSLGEIAQLRGLHILELAETEVTDAGLVEIGKSKQLRNLNLAATNITDTGLIQLKDLKHLNVLDLSFTPLEGSTFDTFDNLPKLTTLELRGTHVKREHLADLNRGRTFHRLSLSETSLTADDLIALLRQDALRAYVLALDGLEINTEVIDQLDRIPYLAWLSLCDIELERGTFERLGNLCHLEFLAVDWDQLNEERLEQIKLYPSLERLAVQRRQKPVTEEELRRIETVLPNVSVFNFHSPEYRNRLRRYRDKMRSRL